MNKAQVIVGAVLGLIDPLIGLLNIFDVLHWTNDQLGAVMLFANTFGAAIVTVVGVVIKRQALNGTES